MNIPWLIFLLGAVLVFSGLWINVWSWWRDRHQRAAVAARPKPVPNLNPQVLSHPDTAWEITLTTTGGAKQSYLAETGLDPALKSVIPNPGDIRHVHLTAVTQEGLVFECEAACKVRGSENYLSLQAQVDVDQRRLYLVPIAGTWPRIQREDVAPLISLLRYRSADDEVPI